MLFLFTSKNTLSVFNQSTILEHGNLEKVICLLYVVIQLNMVWDLFTTRVYASEILSQLKLENLLHSHILKKKLKDYFFASYKI